MTRLIVTLAWLLASPAWAVQPDDVVIACESRMDVRQVYRYRQYVMFSPSIIWPYNADTENAVATKVENYRGWSKAVYRNVTAPSAQGAATLERTTRVDFQAFSRIVEDVYVKKDGTVSEKNIAEFTCKDITPR